MSAVARAAAAEGTGWKERSLYLRERAAVARAAEGGRSFATWEERSAWVKEFGCIPPSLLPEREQRALGLEVVPRKRSPPMLVSPVVDKIVTRLSHSKLGWANATMARIRTYAWEHSAHVFGGRTIPRRLLQQHKRGQILHKRIKANSYFWQTGRWCSNGTTLNRFPSEAERRAKRHFEKLEKRKQRARREAQRREHRKQEALNRDASRMERGEQLGALKLAHVRASVLAREDAKPLGPHPAPAASPPPLRTAIILASPAEPPTLLAAHNVVLAALERIDPNAPPRIARVNFRDQPPDT